MRDGSRAHQDDDYIMTGPEVAEFLRVHLTSIKRWSRSGLIKGYQVGTLGSWRYWRSDVLKALVKRD